MPSAATWTKLVRWILIILTVACLCLVLRSQFLDTHRQNPVHNIPELARPAAASRRPAHNAFNTSRERDFLIPPDDVLRDMSEDDLLLLYWRYVNTVQVLCRNQMRHGSLRDGGKEVCIDEEFEPNKPCLVYSVGSRLRFDFEQSILRAYGCEVHTFDPSIRIDDSNKKRIPKNVSYHEVGLDGRNFVNRNGWTMRTLPSIVQELRHDNRVMDILKIDAEGGEWSGFQDLSHFQPLENVKQLLVELHFGRMNKNQSGGGDYWGGVATIDQLQVLRTLYDRGFRIFMREHTMSHVKTIPTVYGSRLCSINEISLINMKWKA